MFWEDLGRLIDRWTWFNFDVFHWCQIAIIIPYRDRRNHLITLLSYLHPLLQRQQLDYRIFVTEQVNRSTKKFEFVEHESEDCVGMVSCSSATEPSTRPSSWTRRSSTLSIRITTIAIVFMMLILCPKTIATCTLVDAIPSTCPSELMKWTTSKIFSSFLFSSPLPNGGNVINHARD